MKMGRLLCWVFLVLCCCLEVGHAQVKKGVEKDTVSVRQEVKPVVSQDREAAVPDSTVQSVLSAADSLQQAADDLRNGTDSPGRRFLYEYIILFGKRKRFLQK